MTLPPDRLHAVRNYRLNSIGRYDIEKRRVGGFGPLSTVKEHHGPWSVTLETTMMDRLIDWKLRSPATARKMKSSAISEEDHLIRQFTVELRVNYADAEKNEVMRKAIAAGARHIYATAQLLADGVKPDIAIYSDDWFAGKEEINLLEDVIQQGLDESGNAQETEISSELMQAVRDSG